MSSNSPRHPEEGQRLVSKDEERRPGTLHQATRQRTWLRLIAAYKAAEGVLLLGVAVVLLFLDTRGPWLGAVVGWVEHELLVIHFNPLLWLLRALEDFLLGGQLRTAALLALFYAIVHLTEGIGVWFGQRWAEWLMVIATAALIPLELAHLIAQPSLAKVALIAGNAAVVWYLARVLRH